MWSVCGGSNPIGAAWKACPTQSQTHGARPIGPREGQGWRGQETDQASGAPDEPPSIPLSQTKESNLGQQGQILLRYHYASLDWTTHPVMLRGHRVHSPVLCY